uniref:TNase-like domain-containing protein n=1 Tax=Cyanistes caeruleus TaxID=156563 RepID=A0A8C0TWC9_CYACU
MVTVILSSSRSEHSDSASACTAHLIPGKKPLLGLCFYLQTPIFGDSFAVRNKVSIKSVTLTLAVQTPAGQSERLLLIRLAGVELAPGGTAWLQRELLPKQPLWFQLLGRDSSALECLVLVHKGGFLSMCLNEELLRQGLARAARIEGLPHHSRLYWKLHKRLLRAELKAVKKNKGIWKDQNYSERVQERISSNKFLQRLKQFVSWVRSSTER